MSQPFPCLLFLTKSRAAYPFAESAALGFALGLKVSYNLGWLAPVRIVRGNKMQFLDDFFVLSLAMLRYVDEAMFSPFWKRLARSGVAIAAILIPAAFFISVVSPTAKQPNRLMNLACVGALFLAASVLSLGVGLIRASTAHGWQVMIEKVIQGDVNRLAAIAS